MKKYIDWEKLRGKNYKKWVSIISLLLGITGTIIIWVDSQSSINALADLLRETSSTVGFWQDNPIDSNKIENFNSSLMTASKLDIRGFILLMAGFLLQLFTHFDFQKKV